jgi:nucleotide-binding universal stress UspA family protein
MKNILVLIDFTDVSENVLAHSILWAKKFGSKCWLVHVAAPDPEFVGYEIGPKYIRDDRSKILQQEHKDLTSMKNRLEKQGIECEALLIQGYIHETILDEIKKLKIELIIMGNNRHGKLYEVVVGSVGKEVLNKANVPVVVVP